MANLNILMFKMIERAMKEYKIKNTPYCVKVNAVSKVVENVIREKPDELMPVITRIGVVMILVDFVVKYIKRSVI